MWRLAVVACALQLTGRVRQSTLSDSCSPWEASFPSSTHPIRRELLDCSSISRVRTSAFVKSMFWTGVGAMASVAVLNGR